MAADQQDPEGAYATSGSLNRPLCQIFDVQQASDFKSHGMATCADLLQASPIELMSACGRSYDGALDLVVLVSKKIAPKPKTAYQLYQNGSRVASSSFVPTSLHKLDNILQGGLPCGLITEVAGPPGCGKTQFCMTVCSSAIVQGSSAVYIDTEAAFTAQRFLEIATHRWSTPNLVDVLSRNFHIFTELTCSDLHQRLSTLEEFLVEHNVKLIVVDSIASLLRKEFESSTAKSVSERTSTLTSLANSLKYLAQVYRLAILVVNQVTTRIVSHHMEHTVEEDEEGGDVEQEAAIVTVALGDTWAHTVNSRLVMEYLTADLRKMSIVKCPLAPCVSLACKIQLKGVVVDWQATGDLESGKEGVGYGGLTVQSDVSDQIQWTSDLLY